MPISDLIAIASAGVAALALFYVIFKDAFQGARESGKTSVILADIKDRLNSMFETQTRNDAKYEAKFEDYSKRLVTVEESTKSAHHRIDEIREKINL